MFIFNNIDFSNWDMRMVNIDRPIIAPQKISSSVMEGKAEEVFQRKVSSSYNIEVEFYLFSETGLSLISDLRDFAGDLDTDAPAKLIFADEPDKYVMAIVEETEVEKKGRYAIVKVSFKILDPYWYAVTDDVFTYTSTGAKTFTRKGKADSFPVIKIKGTSSSGSFTITANGSTMKYTGALTSSQTLVIDSNLLTAYILKSDGTKTSVLNKLSTLDFPVLKRGQNTLTTSIGGDATFTSVEITCNSRWK